MGWEPNTNQKNVIFDLFSHSIDFSVISPVNITQISEAEVKTFELYEKARIPVQNGPLDLRMGVGHKSMTCATCNKSL